jgi:hypothetical protein
VTGIQVVAIAFALLMGYQTYIDLRRGELTLAGGVMWLALWLGLFLVSLLPGVFEHLNGVVRVARLLDLVVIVGMLAFSALTYRVYLATRRLERRLDALVRELALGGVDIEAGEEADPKISAV